MNKHAKLDEAIVEYLRTDGTVHPIYSRRLSDVARDDWRLIDRRLQALRKDGRIVYRAFEKRWRVVE